MPENKQSPNQELHRPDDRRLENAAHKSVTVFALFPQSFSKGHVLYWTSIGKLLPNYGGHAWVLFVTVYDLYQGEV